MEKTPNFNAPTLKLVNGPAGRDNYEHRAGGRKTDELDCILNMLDYLYEYEIKMRDQTSRLQ
jgi:hypothetical protein